LRVYWVRLSRGQPYWIIIMDNLTQHWLYTGQVVHKRIGHAAHQFVYPALFICFPLESRKQLSNRLCSYNRFNVLSFHEKDYGNGVDAQAWIDDVLTRHDLQTLLMVKFGYKPNHAYSVTFLILSIFGIATITTATTRHCLRSKQYFW
jgi:hypothetical protein